VAASDVISFGLYRLIPAERILLKQEEVVDVGNRALDILVALAETAGEVVSQSELTVRAWPNVVVGEASLRVTIAGLRKALGDGQDEDRYISNVTGGAIASWRRSRVQRDRQRLRSPCNLPRQLSLPPETSCRLALPA
jgi:DNA-binding winged helix-turn-helix (wHTH) protein